MKKKIIKVLIWFVSILTVLIAVFAVVLYLNKDKIERLIVNEINDNLAVPVNTSAVDISLKKFPKASLRFADVYTRGINSIESDTLLYAKSVFFEFDLWKLISDNVTIDQISFEGALFDLKLFKNNSNNFKIWKDSKNSDNEIFTLSQISLNTVKIRLFDEASNLKLQIDIDKNQLKGTFSSTEMDINSEGSLTINNLIRNDSPLLTNIKSKLNFNVSNRANTDLTITGALQALKSLFAFNVELRNESTRITANNEKIDLKILRSFLTDQKLIAPIKWDVKGKTSLDFELSLKKDKPLTYRLAFEGQNCVLNKKGGLNLSELEFSGFYASKGEKDHLNIESISANGKSGEITGSLIVDNFKRPNVKAHLVSNIGLEEINSLYPIDTIKSAVGDLTLDIYFENQFRSFEKIGSNDFKNLKTSGSLELKNAELVLRGWDKKIKSLNGSLNFKNNRINVNQLAFQLNESDLSLNGIIDNTIKFALLEKERLKVDCQLKSKNIQLEDFIQTQSNSNESYNLSFTESVALNLKLDVDQFSMRKFKATDIHGLLKIDNNIIDIRNLTLSSDEGSYAGNVKVKVAKEGEHQIAAQLSVKEINIHKLFKSFDDFGQDAISNKNIYGTLTAKANFSAKINADLRIDPNSISLESDIELNNGNIKDYEPMLALSKFSDLEDLKDVHFNSLKNHISISNSVIYIPEMKIVSNVLDLQINGQHGFDNVVSYRLKLKASDALFKKRKTRTNGNSEFDKHLKLNGRKDDHYIFIKMSGPMDKIKIELDNRSIGKSINEDFNKQGQELKKIFKKKEKEKKTDDPGIIFEWDDEDDG